MHAVGDRADADVLVGQLGQEPEPQRRETRAWSCETALAWPQSRSARTAIEKGSPGLPGASWPSLRNSSTGEPGAGDVVGADTSRPSSGGKRSMPAGTGVWVVNTLPAAARSRASEKVRPSSRNELPDLLQADERGVPLVDVPDRRPEPQELQRAQPSDAEHDLLADAHLLVAAVQARRDVPVVADRSPCTSVSRSSRGTRPTWTNRMRTWTSRSPTSTVTMGEPPSGTIAAETRQPVGVQRRCRLRAGRLRGSATAGSSRSCRRGPLRRAAAPGRSPTSDGRRPGRRGRPRKSAGAPSGRTRRRNTRRGLPADASRGSAGCAGLRVVFDADLRPGPPRVSPGTRRPGRLPRAAPAGRSARSAIGIAARLLPEPPGRGRQKVPCRDGRQVQRKVSGEIVQALQIFRQPRVRRVGKFHLVSLTTSKF